MGNERWVSFKILFDSSDNAKEKKCKALHTQLFLFLSINLKKIFSFL